MSTTVDTGRHRLHWQTSALSGSSCRVQIKDRAMHATNVQFQDLVRFHHIAAQHAPQ